MKLLKAEVHNFGSYKHLEFKFNDLGLALVHGATGAGKSTLQDIPAWILYGVTAKDGNADEIRSWTNPDEPTIGVLNVETTQGLLTVHRTRGRSNQNDLFFIDADNQPKRGKDLTETQKLLEQRLGVTKDLYIAGAYYNEFSPTGAFFTAKAKDRRDLFEKLADLELAKTIAERTSDVRKTTKKELDKGNNLLDRLHSKSESLRNSLQDATLRGAGWLVQRTRSIDLLGAKSQNFETEKTEKIKRARLLLEKFDKENRRKLEAYEKDAMRLESSLLASPLPHCPSCGEPNAKVTKDLSQLQQLETYIKFHQEQKNPHLSELDHAQSFVNPYDEQLEAEKSKENPFTAQIEGIEKDIADTESKVQALQAEVASLNHKITSLTQLNELSFELRGLLLNRAVKEIETSTNNYLEKYFDSELRVGFELEGSDDLNISITKNGYQGVYKQLSKGQRGLLKLAFSVSVMRAAANTAGTHFGTLFFDEPADGADPEIKVKCFQFFEALSLQHSSVLVIDHTSELKSLFSSKFLVTMNNDNSEVTVDDA